MLKSINRIQTNPYYLAKSDVTHVHPKQHHIGRKVGLSPVARNLILGAKNKTRLMAGSNIQMVKTAIFVSTTFDGMTSTNATRQIYWHDRLFWQVKLPKKSILCIKV
jgi:hypothetical protein